MPSRFVLIGKTKESWLKSGMAEYVSRIKRYTRFEVLELNPPKLSAKAPESEWKKREFQLLQEQTKGHRVLLDVSGRQLDSPAFAQYLEQTELSGQGHIDFIVGGPYGFDQAMYDLVPAKHRLSLSAMTYSHQIVRLVFLEQLYRAYTIRRGEPYHHA